MKRGILGLIMVMAVTVISYQCLRFHMYIPILLLFLGLFSFSMVLRAKEIKEYEDEQKNVDDMEFYIKNRDKIKEMEKTIREYRDNDSTVFYNN